MWDLLDLLGLPPGVDGGGVPRLLRGAGAAEPPADALDRMARLFQAVERDHGPVGRAGVERLTGLSSLKAGRMLRALRDAASIPRRQIETPERRAALAVLRAHTLIRRLISRHTRALLRRYFRGGRLKTPIAERRADRFLELTAAERSVYEAVERYISTTWDQAAGGERSAVGFVMTIYRLRLASSFRALRATFEHRLEAMTSGGPRPADPDEARLHEDAPDDERRSAPTRPGEHPPARLRGVTGGGRVDRCGDPPKPVQRDITRTRRVVESALHRVRSNRNVPRGASGRPGRLSGASDRRCRWRGDLGGALRSAASSTRQTRAAAGGRGGRLGRFQQAGQSPGASSPGLPGCRLRPRPRHLLL